MARKTTPDPERVIIGLVDFDVNELASYHKNPRRGDVDAIARSLAVNGQCTNVQIAKAAGISERGIYKLLERRRQQKG